MPRGYDRALYIQPFDHRGSFQSGLFGWKPPLSDAQTAEIGQRSRLWDPLIAWKAGKATREQAAAQIAQRYREFVDLFEKSSRKD